LAFAELLLLLLSYTLFAALLADRAIELPVSVLLMIAKYENIKQASACS
jgi:hypothetical protein